MGLGDFSQVSVAKLKMVRGYSTNAIILYNVINQARDLEKKIVVIDSLQKREQADLKSGKAERVISEEKKIIKNLGLAASTATKMMFNTLEFLHRFENEVLDQVKRDQELQKQGISHNLADYIKMGDAKTVQELKKLFTNVANMAQGLSSRLG
ncbi:MAG: hypothetical protein ABIJ08_03400 [Nanoarchaeota archaeon]